MNPKYNPARTYTPQGAIGIGGSFMCLYPTASPVSGPHMPSHASYRASPAARAHLALLAEALAPLTKPRLRGPCRAAQGGYQLVGRSLPIWNAFTVNSLYEPGKPWLLRMFDQVRFYEVSDEELEDAFEKFKHGLYVPRTETEVFDVAAYTEWINTPEMVAKIKEFETARAAGEASIDWSEPQPNPLTKLLADLTEAAGALLYGNSSDDDGGTPVPAPCAANVWKVNVKPGQLVKEGEALVVLEAMKMEYALDAPCSGVVTAIKVKQGAAVKQGDVLLSIADAP
jgi:urea carboxylase